MNNWSLGSNIEGSIVLAADSENNRRYNVSIELKGSQEEEEDPEDCECGR